MPLFQSPIPYLNSGIIIQNYNFLVAYDIPTNHVSKLLWYVVMFSFPPILPLATKYIKLGVDLVYKERGGLYTLI